MKLWILAAIAILLLVWGVREGFNPATERPTKTDSSLRRAVEASTGTTKATVVDSYIEAIQAFYDTTYLPEKKTPEARVVREFVDKQEMKPEMTKDALKRVIEYVFLSTSPPMSEGSERTGDTPASDPSRTSGNTTGGSSGITRGPNSGGGGDRRRQVFGPLFMGEGEGGGVKGADSSKTNRYPQLLGGDGGKASTRIEGAGIVTPTLPFSIEPGDMDLIPDPYRVSQQFSTSSYSSKTEPVPFLTDFSAFQT